MLDGLIMVDRLEKFAFYHQLKEAWLHHYHQHHVRFTYAGILGGIGYFIFYFINTELYPQQYESFLLRLITVILWFSIGAEKYWPERYKRFYPLAVYITLFVNLSYFSVFMLFANEANILWSTSWMMTLFFLALVMDRYNMILFFTIGLLGGFITYAAVFQTTEVPETFFEIFPLFITAIIIHMYFDYTSQAIEDQTQYEAQLQALKGLGGSIAHEMRTPLANISMSASNLNVYWEQLWDMYDQMVEDGKEVPFQVPEWKRDLLSRLPDTIEDDIHTAQFVISMLLETIRQGGNLGHERFEVLDIRECVQTYIDGYPFTSDEECTNIVFDERNSFRFLGSETMLAYAFHNLMRNSLYFIQKAQKGSIYISFSKSNEFNTLCFRDTGTGIAETVLPQIFDEFFTTKTGSSGTGLGLPFCKRVMKSFGGDIDCQSQEGLTEFTLYFPKAPETSNDTNALTDPSPFRNAF